jgi:hypothetical protein
VRSPANGSLLLDDERYFRFLADTHPTLRLSTTRLPVPSYVAPLDVREPLLRGPVRAALGVGRLVSPSHVTPRSLFLGTPFERYEQTHILDDVDDVPALVRDARRIAARAGLDVVCATCLDPDHRRVRDLTRAGFVALPSFPDTVVTLRGESFDDHLAQLPAADRSGIRRNIRRFERAGLRLERLSRGDADADALFSSYRPMFERAAVKWLPHTPSYFAGIAQLDERVRLTVARAGDGEVAGFIINFEDGEDDAHRRVFQAGRVGIAPRFFRKHAVYFRLLYHVIEESQRLGGTHLSLEPTGYRMKRHLGAERKPMINLVLGVSATWRLALKTMAGVGRALLSHLDEDKTLERHY